MALIRRRWCTADLAYLSGQIPLDPASNKVIEGGISAQTERVLENIKAVLEACGASLDSVLKTTVFLKDMEDFAPMNQIYGRYFAKDPPARSTVQAAKLPRDVSVEIDVIAAIFEPKSPEIAAATVRESGLVR